MKTKIFSLIAALVFLACTTPSQLAAQSHEAQQLLLNVEKLTQLKNILTDMKKGYATLSNGYSAVKNISQGNFSLHELFLDAMMLVSPQVKKYGRIKDIIQAEKAILGEYQAASRFFQKDKTASAADRVYLKAVHNTVLAAALVDLDELTTILTASVLRMTDDERMDAIDQVYGQIQEKLLFIRSFNASAKTLLLQRKAAFNDIGRLKKLFGKP